jgi:hypothetical protein
MTVVCRTLQWQVTPVCWLLFACMCVGMCTGFTPIGEQPAAAHHMEVAVNHAAHLPRLWQPLWLPLSREEHPDGPAAA